MHIRGDRLLLSFAFCCGAALLGPALGQGVEIEGTGSVAFHPGVFSNRADDATRQHVLALAEADALDRYAASFSASKYKLYQRVEDTIKVNAQEYLTQPIVVDEGYQKEQGTYSIVIRTTINENRLDAALGGSGPNEASQPAMQRKIAITFLFVARSTTSVKQFDARITNVAVNNESRSARQSEGLSGGRANFSSSSSSTSELTNGGNVVRQADQLTYAVSSPEDMNAAMSQVFSDSGFDVYDYRDVSAQCGGTKPEVVYAGFSTADMLTRDVRQSTFNAAKRCGVNTFATGTLDIGLQDVDPVTGQKRVYVSVRTQVNDLTGPLPRLLASVGPVQYSGLGPDQQVAMRNALIHAAQEAAEEISNQLKSKGMN